jgi:hypothetical protein
MKHETKGLVAHDIRTRDKANKTTITKVRKLSHKQVKTNQEKCLKLSQKCKVHMTYNPHNPTHFQRHKFRLCKEDQKHVSQ